MKYVTITIGGITQSVPEADVALYTRAGYSVVDEKAAPVEPVMSSDQEILAKIASATEIKDLYALQDLYPNRSEAVENALNLKGNEIMEAEASNPVPATSKAKKSDK